MKNRTYWSDLGQKKVWEPLVKVLNTVLPESLGLQEAEIADNAALFPQKCDGLCRTFIQFYAMKLWKFVKKKNDRKRNLQQLGIYPQQLNLTSL